MRRLVIVTLGLVGVLALVATVGRAATGDYGYPGQSGIGLTASGYNPDRQKAAFRSTLSTADTLANVRTATTAFELFGRPTVSISGRFSVASQTCLVQVFYFHVDSTGTYYLGKSATATLTADSVIGPSGKYDAPSAIFDGAGATHLRVALVTAPASGNVDLWVGSY
jgi:hypothetical protein